MYDRIKTALLRFADLSDNQLSEVINRLQRHEVAKGNILFKEGQICRHFYFIDSGCFRQCMTMESGVEATLNLWVDGEWMFDHKSFISQQPAIAHIEAADDSLVFTLGGHDFHELVKISDIFFRLGSIMEDGVKNNDYQHNRLSPEEKYELLLAKRPELIQRFPLKHIASYLGMTPETLSRVRKKISS